MSVSVSAAGGPGHYEPSCPDTIDDRIDAFAADVLGDASHVQECIDSNDGIVGVIKAIRAKANAVQLPTTESSIRAAMTRYFHANVFFNAEFGDGETAMDPDTCFEIERRISGKTSEA